MALHTLRLSHDLNSSNTLSLLLRYLSGSAWVAMENKIGVHQYPPLESVYSQALPWDSYLLAEKIIGDEGHNGTLFVREVHHSLPFVTAYPRVAADLATYDQTVAKMKDEFAKIPKDVMDKEWVKKKLKHMFDVDQYMREFFSTPFRNGYSQEEKDTFALEFSPRFAAIDAADTRDLSDLLKIYDWIKISEFGEIADQQAWLIAQHADDNPAFQVEVLEILERMWPLKETQAANYGYLYDRVAASWSDLRKQRPQRYGTQGMCAGSGNWKPVPIEDEAGLERRRAELGIRPFSEYKKEMDQGCH